MMLSSSSSLPALTGNVKFDVVLAPMLRLIGDTIDDHDAAVAIGIGSIVVATGMQTRQRLESTGAPIVDGLREVAAFFLAQ